MGIQEGEAWKGNLRRSRAINTCLVSVAAVLSVFIFLGGASVDASRKSRFGFAPKTKLTWVNGIGYNSGHMELEAPRIAKYFGGKKVEFYHNPTKMVDEKDTKGYFSDLTQAGQQKYLGRITSEVNGLVDHLRAAIRSVENINGIVVHIAHSQGALVTCLAAKQLTPLEMNRIEVITFGGATPVRSTPETPFLRCVNYYSVNDPLLFLNPSAESALRSGFNRHQYSIRNNPNENEDEFCFLAPRVGDPIADHMLLGPTYASALEWEGRRFERKYQSYLRRTVRFAVLASLPIVSMIFQFLLYIWRKLATVQSELRTRLRHNLVQTLAAKIRAIQSLIIAMLAHVVAVTRVLRNRTTVPVVWESELDPSLRDTPLIVTKAPVTMDSMAEKGSLLGFRRKTKISMVNISENETISRTAAAVKSRWIPSKNEIQHH